MPHFKAPYGTADQHVISPAQHLGYHYIVAYHVNGGSMADYVRRACAEAHDERAPKDVVCHTNDGWKRRGEVTNLMHGRRLDSYVRALIKYEQELKTERAQRST